MKYPRLPSSHSQGHLNEVGSPSAGPVKVLTTCGNVPTQPVSRPVMLPLANRSPKAIRRSDEFAAQLTGRGAVRANAGRTGQGTL